MNRPRSRPQPARHRPGRAVAHHQRRPWALAALGVAVVGAAVTALVVTSLGDDVLGRATSRDPQLVSLVAGLAATTAIAMAVYVLGTSRAWAIAMVDQVAGELQHRALHDSLTGLPNRTLVTDRADALLIRCRRMRTEPAALWVDVDGFKALNDSLGHVDGDHLLRAVAARLARAVPGVDTVGRMGADEFVVLLDGIDPPGGPQQVADTLLRTLRDPFLVGRDAVSVRLTASIGIAAGNRTDGDELLRDARIALHDAQSAGRDCWRSFSCELHSAALRRTAVEFALRRLEPDRDLHLVYQPIYDLVSGTMIGAEVLLRWDDPRLGAVAPPDFVPLLERSGQIVGVGRWVLDRACEQLARWHAAGHHIDLSVNVSARQLEHDDFIGHLGAALLRTGIDPRTLTIEITETALMIDPARTASALCAAKALGVRVAIDDFGTGYSSLAYLQRFPVDALKIDREFVRQLSGSWDSVAMVRTIVHLARQLGLVTVAEGVEREPQLDQLRAEHVDHVQGFLLSHPVGPCEMLALLGEPTASARH